jgi:hypothetical protein
LNTQVATAAQPITARDILHALDDAVEWADGLDVDDVLAPIIRALRKLIPQLSQIDAELMLADARSEITPKLDDLISFNSLREAFRDVLAREFDDE